jgi:hypothetical protein
MPRRTASPAVVDERAQVLRELQRMPNIGRSIAVDLWDLGVRRQSDLIGRDPQALYDELMAQRGAYIDRCQLYVFRAAVYFAETQPPAPELVAWWEWSDKALLARGADPAQTLTHPGRARRGAP